MKGIEIYKDIFGEYPYTYVEHGGISGRHPEGMVKKESLSSRGSDIESNYYIKDIVESVFKCVWERKGGLFDESGPDWTVKNVDDVLSFENGVARIRRHRMKNLDYQYYLNLLSENEGIFMGYTHFGYRGLESRFLKNTFNIPTFFRDLILDCYYGNFRIKRAVRRLSELKEEYGFDSITIQEFVERNKK